VFLVLLVAYYDFGIRVLTTLRNVGDMVMSRRLLRVVFPRSPVLKWSCPAFRLSTLPVPVIFTRFFKALCVLSFIGVETMRHDLIRGESVCQGQALTCQALTTMAVNRPP
jgi:hypothetical protein